MIVRKKKKPKLNKKLKISIHRDKVAWLIKGLRNQGTRNFEMARKG